MKKYYVLGFGFFLAAFLFCQNVPRPTETPGSIEDALAAAKSAGPHGPGGFFLARLRDLPTASSAVF